jgi:hypothetical protein
MVGDMEDEAWSDHRGGPCPVGGDKKIVVRYRNGIQSPEIAARERRWEAWPRDIGDSDWDIVAWRLSSSQ